jgi:hypothetical protein
MKKWPTNAAWRQFAARIADGVAVAINSGHIITDKTDKFSPSRECMCPMGAALRLKAPIEFDYEPFPTVDVWMDKVSRRDCDMALFFQEAFDGEHENLAAKPKLENDLAARRLGLWYRSEFVG